MKYLKFDVDVNTWYVREPDPKNKFDGGRTEGEVIINGCSLIRKNEFNALPAPNNVKVGDTIWLVWAQYTDGDSFGSYGGRHELCSVFDNEKQAWDEARLLNAIEDYSVPWNYYFAWLDNINVDKFIITEGNII